MNLDLGALLTAGLVAVAIAGLVRSPPRQLGRAIDSKSPNAERHTTPWAGTARGPGIRGLVLGRVDAPPLMRRVVTSLGAAVAMAIALGGLGSTARAIGWACVPLAAATGVVMLGALEPLASRRRRRQLLMDAPAALELMAAALAAGLPPRNATAAVVGVFQGPVAEDLATVLAAVDVGMSDAMAWRGLRNHPAFGDAAVDLARSVESGTMMVETLAHHARNARLRRQAAVEVAAKAVGVRCVLPMMICFIPAFLLLGIVPTVASAFLAALPAGFLGAP